MNYLKLLPEKWEKVSTYRTNKYRDHTLQMRTKKAGFEFCNKCPGLRIRIIDVYGYEYMLTSCVFINKCICLLYTSPSPRDRS